MNYNIKCLGSFKGIGGIAWFYLLNMNNSEYAVIRSEIKQAFKKYALIISKWTEENTLVDTDFSEEIEQEILKQCDSIEKTDVIFTKWTDYEKYFTQHEIKEVDLKHYTGEEYSGDEINNILDIFDKFDFIYNNEGIIDQEMIDFEMEEYGSDSLQRLLNYKVDIETDGEHKNDGQMVEYYFTFTSPDGVISNFATDMCLMVGWNHYDNEIIK
jgi:hypothetical protein